MIWAHQAIDHFDQGRFTGAVFSQKSMNFSRANIETHIIIGYHTGIGFGEPAEVQKWLTHRMALLLTMVAAVLRNTRA